MFMPRLMPEITRSMPSPLVMNRPKEAQSEGVPSVAHPECRRELLEKADFVGSTAAMLKHIHESDSPEFIVVTESGIRYELERQNPDKKFYFMYDGDPKHDCFNMKKNNLENIYQALLNEEPELVMDEELRKQALLPLQRMLEMS